LFAFLHLLLPPNLSAMSNRTFTMIKPDATGKGYTGAILDQIIKGGLPLKQ